MKKHVTAQWKLIAVIFTTLIMLCTQAERALALELRIRNDFNKKMFVTAVYFDDLPQKWRTRGWYVTEPLSENNISLNTSNPTIYLFAELSDSIMTWGNGDITRTVIAEVFSYFDGTACPPGRYRRNVRLTKYEANDNVIQFRPSTNTSNAPLNVAVKPPVPKPAKPTTQAIAGSSFSKVDPTTELLNLINAERRKVGVPALRLDINMQKAANRRASEITRKYSHTRPNGKGSSTVLAEYGIAPSINGENISWRSGKDNMGMKAFNKAFMNSPAHRSNMLNRNFSSIGLGFARDGNRLYVAELFAGNF